MAMAKLNKPIKASNPETLLAKNPVGQHNRTHGRKSLCAKKIGVSKLQPFRTRSIYSIQMFDTNSKIK